MKFIRDINVVNKRVLIRADFNVDLDEGKKIIDDFRIRATLPTISYLMGKGAKIILMSHLGDPGATNGLPAIGLPQAWQAGSLRLLPIRAKLQELLKTSIIMAGDCVGNEVREMARDLKSGQILFLENLRFHKEEKANDEKFAKELADLGDIYVNDAFAVSHRKHASLCAITKFIPPYAGLLLEKEIGVLEKAMKKSDHPLVVIIGGAKVSTKMKVIKNFLNVADDIILGGALANTVLHAKGIAIGKSIIEEKMTEDVKNIEITNTKIHIPVDTIVSIDKSGEARARIAPVGKTEENELILDIGPETEKLFGEVVKGAKTIIWNGPMGLFEKEKFANGTEIIARAVADCQCYSVVGGGETISYIDKLGLAEKFSHISTGGGAMLKFLAGEKLPGLIALET